MKPSCDEIQDLIIEKEGNAPLPNTQERMIQRHLTQCPACRVFRNDVRRVLQDLREMSLPTLPDPFFDEIREQVLHSLEDAVPSSSRAGRRFVPRFRERFSGWLTLTHLATGALGILIGIVVTLALRPGPSPSPQSRLFLAPSVPFSTGAVVPAVELSSVPLHSGDIEKYLGTDELFDTLEIQAPQALLFQSAGEVPDELLDEEDYGAG